MKLKHTILITAGLMATGASAQYNPTIAVEGTYKPEIILQDRINMYPQREKTGMIDSRLDFDTRGVITDFEPNGVPMTASGWNTIREDYPWRGYVDIGLGSWLDARLNAGYRWLQSPSTLSGAYLRHNSTSLWKPKMQGGNDDTRRWMYDETIGAYVRHKTSAGMLDADLHYNLACFNYYGTVDRGGAGGGYVPSQTVNRLHANVLWHGGKEDARLRYHGGVTVRYTGFRSVYDAASHIFGKGTRETMITPRAGVEYDMSKVSKIGIDARGDAVVGGNGAGSYGRVSLTPYYQASGEHIDFKAGPRIDLVIDNGPVFRIAPEMRFAYATRGVTFAIEANGGTLLNTAEREAALSLYGNPLITDPRPIYKPVEAWLKFKFGPFAGFQALLEGGFKYVVDQRIGGWYQYSINDPAARNIYDFNGTRRFDTYGFSVGMTLNYKYGRWIELTATGAYQPQEGKKSWFNGWDLPEVTAGVSAKSNPWSSLKLGIDWNLRACRKPLLWKTGTGADTEPSLVNMSMANMSELSFNASYDIIKNLTVSLDIRNLLNRRQEILPGLPTPGVTVMGCLTWQF